MLSEVKTKTIARNAIVEKIARPCLRIK